MIKMVNSRLCTFYHNLKKKKKETLLLRALAFRPCWQRGVRAQVYTAAKEELVNMGIDWSLLGWGI